MPTIKPGETFFDHLPDGRYEKCVLLPTTGDEPDRHAAARGGTGEFYRALSNEEIKERADDETDDVQMIFEVEAGMPFPKIVFLVRT